MQTITIQETLRSIDRNRGYASTYQSSERSERLDGRNFSDLDEQRRFFAERRAAAYRALAADLTTLCVQLAERISAEKHPIKIEAMRDEIAILKAEIDCAWKNSHPYAGPPHKTGLDSQARG